MNNRTNAEIICKDRTKNFRLRIAFLGWNPHISCGVPKRQFLFQNHVVLSKKQPPNKKWLSGLGSDFWCLMYETADSPRCL